MGNAIVLIGLGIVVALAIRSLWKSHKTGGGCNGNCGSCNCGCH